MADKRAALVDLGRHLGMFVDKHELTGKGGGPIETHELSPEERAAAARKLIDETFDLVRGGAYSPRARPGFPIAAPIAWKDVERGVRSDQFTIAELPRRR